MDNGKKTILEFFSGQVKFHIPDYQRLYAWEKKQVLDFFNDFKNPFLNGKYYYGAILLQEIVPNRKYEVVDGQQRITTLVIFLSLLFKQFNKLGIDEYDEYYSRFIEKKESYVLSLQREDSNFFTSNILGDEKSIQPVNPSQRKLQNAKQIFSSEIAKSSKEQLKIIAENIIQTNILVYLVDGRAEATMIFETTNDRGKALSNLEKAKSFLMYKASAVLEDSDDLLKNIQDKFNMMYKHFSLIENFQTIKDENSIMQYSYIANEDWKQSQSSGKEYQRYIENLKLKIAALEVLEDKKIVIEYIKKYINDLQNSFSNLSIMFENLSKYTEFNDLLVLGRVANFYPLLIKVFEYDDDDNKINFRKICRICEIFVFRVYVIGRKFTSKYQSKFYLLAKNFKGDFSSLFDSLVLYCKEIVDDSDFADKLLNPNFYKDYWKGDQNYFFWKYENYLRVTKQPVSTKISHADLVQRKNRKLAFTIEHIVARRNNNEHSRIILDDSIIRVGQPKPFNETYLESIGNLAIDPQSSNSSSGAADVADKISKYFAKAPYKSHLEIQFFLIDGIWTRESIEKRRDRILDFAKKTWNVSNRNFGDELIEY